MTDLERMPASAALVAQPLTGDLLPAPGNADPVLSDPRMVRALALALHARSRHSGPAEFCQCWSTGQVLAEVAVDVRLAGWAQSTTSTDRCTCGHEVDEHQEYPRHACRATVECPCKEYLLAERVWIKTRTMVERFTS